MAEPLIATSGLTHAFGDVLALDRVSVEIPPGRIGLVGANGAGKTTFIKILLGLLQPAAGTVRVLSADSLEDPLSVREQTGYLPETACLPRDQTAADFVAYAAELGGLPASAARQRSSEVLFLVGLHEERFRYIGDFSTGMQQRVKLAQAIVHDPKLVLLDEPTSGLDPEGREQMLELVSRLGEFDINVVFSSHILADIERTCEWVVMLAGGRLVRAGRIGDLGLRDAVAVETLDPIAATADLLERRGAHVERDGPHTIHVRTDGPETLDLIRDVLADTGAGLRRLGTGAVSLEDVFLEEAGTTDA